MWEGGGGFTLPTATASEVCEFVLMLDQTDKDGKFNEAQLQDYYDRTLTIELSTNLGRYWICAFHTRTTETC